jgi:dipeptidase E
MRLLLIGATGSPYYEHCKQELVNFLARSKRIGVITAVNLLDEEIYFRGIDDRLTENEPRIAGGLVHIRWDSNPLKALAQVDALIIPGGNTYALLKRLYHSGLCSELRDRIRDGLPYVGSSAGANVAGPNILTTNDWNVVGLTHFESLGVVPFNINPHYIERSISDAPHSESRDARIREYHKFWNNPVIAIEEDAVISIINGHVRVLGPREGQGEALYQR